ncbi:TadE/TadG family type IV pilus assembly protein [Actinoplanes awajinensis]|uniref:TadE/TadG family type IV pilus assembly protein n=1 Tax=Actinoplanes awajinensis TaxID=135946 RepID=UPI0018DB12AC|nr:pilus assembly protein TadG-related protein [Actinoplanes awajinensis]
MTRTVWSALRPPRHDGEPDDHGVITALVAILAGTGVLLGMCALVVDIGVLYVEREQLQSGADAASWKIAQTCANTPANCTMAKQLINAQTYASNNAKDLISDVQICLVSVAATGVATNAAGCPSSATWNTPVTCPPLPTTSGPYQYVEVRTSTKNTDGTTVVAPIFGQALPGTPYTGTTMGACARVAWGTPMTANAFALGISKCDFDRMTTGGTVFQGLGALDPLLQQTGVYGLLGASSPANDMVTIANNPLNKCNPTNILDGTQKGWTWLLNQDMSAPDSNCMIRASASTATTDYYTWAAGAVIGLLAGTSLACVNALDNSKKGQILMVPIWDKVLAVTNLLPAQYRIVGFAPFVVVERASLFGIVAKLPDLLSVVERTLCLAQTCIYGHFTRSLVANHLPNEFASTTNFGATVIGRTG